jgi:DNA-binding IclR family transcriptional regulator
VPTSNIVNSVLRSAEILKVLSDGIDRISDLSNRLNLSKSTIHRFLKSLEASGFVTQDPVTRRYYLGSLVLNLASKPIIAHQKLIVASFGEMKYLRDLTRETIVLHVRIGLERICLEELESPENIRYIAGKGVVAPIHTGSAGKMLLSEMEDHDLQLLLNNIRFSKVGPNTITDKRKFMDELMKAKKQGYATSFSERIPGGASISVPIKHYICPVALSVLGPDNRFSLDVMQRFVKKIKESASRISKHFVETHQERSLMKF